MKSDPAVSPTGIARPAAPPSPPTRPLAFARPNAPRVTASLAAAPSRPRYLSPAPSYARGRVGTDWFSFLRDTNLILLMLLAVILVGMFFAFAYGQTHLTIWINDQQSDVWTRQKTVRSALTEAGISWHPEDIVRPGLDAPLPANGKIVIQPAVPIILSADGNESNVRTQATTIQEILKENSIALKPQDQVFLDGRLVLASSALPQYSTTNDQPALLTGSNGLIRLSVTRALPITIDDNGTISTLYTTENTLGTALTRAGVQLYVGDSISPDLTTPVTTGASVFIRRSRPATITVDGHTLRTRTQAKTVGELLAQAGVKIEGKDFSDHAPTDPIVDYTAVNITRVREEYVTQTEQIAYQTKWLPSKNLELDQDVVAQTGVKGIKQRLFKSVYENGKLISNGLEREWIAQAPQDYIINYGTKVVVRDLTLPDGSTQQYWRKVRLLATAYSAATSGKSADHPEYGRTRLGLQAGRGVVAVDPRVINLSTQVYVPGYGLAIAGDTGGRVKGRRIDLGYPDGQMEDWYRWVDVYLLTPVPPASQIDIVIPDYPVERTKR